MYWKLQIKNIFVLCSIVLSMGLEAKHIKLENSHILQDPELARPYEQGGRYYNYAGEPAIINAFKSKLNALWEKKLFNNSFVDTADLQQWIYFQSPLNSSDTLTIQYIGHGTCLIQLNGFNILTDALFENVSLFTRRVVPAGVSAEKLPKIDFILISHNHTDALNTASLKKFTKDNPIILAPEGTRSLLKKLGFSHVYEHTWWQQYQFTYREIGIACTFVPAHHYSQRTPFDTNQSLWGGWMIQTAQYTVYFAGDTAFHMPFIENITTIFPRIDVAILPIAPHEPREILRTTHMSPQEAGEMFSLLKADYFVPIKWGTFVIGTDTFESPVKTLRTWWTENFDRVSVEQLCLLRFGERKTFN